MGLDYAPYHKRRVNRRKIRRGILERLFVWFEYPLVQAGVGPLVTLSSLVAALVAVNVATDHFETDALTKQLSEDRAEFEKSLGKMQADIEKLIPPRVRRPLPIFPENGQTLLLGPSERKKVLELEWADRDRDHRHKYLVQVVCIAEIPRKNSFNEPSERFQIKRDKESHCGTDKLDADTPEAKKLYTKTFHWTQPGVDSVKVLVEGAGTYAWRVARAESNSDEEITIFEEWSSYYIFTVFESIDQRFETISKVLVGTVHGSALLEKEEGETKEKKARTSVEKSLVKSIQENRFKSIQEHYLPYPTYEALIAAVARGEVDYAIGEITRAKYREKREVFFTRGYAPALPVFVTKSSRIRPPEDGDTIGVVRGSISERALAHLTESKKFAIVKEFTLGALEEDLKRDIVHFIFTERAYHLQASPELENLTLFGTLYSDLKDFYHNELGYRAKHAIATADYSMCKALDSLVGDALNHLLYDGVVQRMNMIYREEGKSFFNLSLYYRLMDLFDEFFNGDDQGCDYKNI